MARIAEVLRVVGREGVREEASHCGVEPRGFERRMSGKPAERELAGKLAGEREERAVRRGGDS